ncbi:hypothetical protein [Pedobacter arcticus]|uniref:hypothetical protein n=1 Tax=Pedobacter arcticus TaxID=752140 RepID=UPI00031957B7|nr:hypothetical protein [Pedobacter arcticus]
MKKTILYLAGMCLIFACTSDTKNTENVDHTQETTSTAKTQPEKLFDVPWAAVLDSTSQKISMQQTVGVNDEDLNLANVTESLNRKYPEITITEPTQKGDTVFIKIKDASYLTQGSGSMGAEIYMAECTYSFTQIPGVTFVNFDFATGDHASPGTFKRSDFEFKK